MSRKHIERRINGLRTIKVTQKRWKHMQAQKESRHERHSDDPPVWKKNPIRQIERPTSVEVYKNLPDRLRRRMLDKLSVVRHFDPKKLVTDQPYVLASQVQIFACDEELARKRKIWVFLTEDGPYIWNGNHRCVAAWAAKRKVRAHVMDLRG